jgi:adenylate cyclase
VINWLNVQRKAIPLFINMLIILAAIWVANTNNTTVRTFIQRIDYLTYDLRLKLALTDKESQIKTKTPVVIVDIDEKSLHGEGRWPWSRKKMAKLVKKIREQGAIVIAFDILFSEPEKNITQDIIKELETKKVIKPGLAEAIQALAPYFATDAMLAKALQGDDVVLGIFFHQQSHYSKGALPKATIDVPPQLAKKLAVIKLSGYTGNLALLQESAKYGAFLTTFVDPDGIIRRSPLLIRYKNKLYPSLALEAARLYLLEDNVKLNTSDIGGVKALDSISLGGQVIPTDAKGQVIIPYRGLRGSFRYYSATDILNDKLKPKTLDNALVFIGTSALGLSDLKAVPMQAVYPGVEVHATIAAGILANKFPYRPNWAKGAEFLLIILVGLVLGLLLPFFGSVWQTLMMIFTLSFLITLDAWLALSLGLILSFTVPILMVIVLAIVNLMYGFFFETRRRRILKNTFGQYVPPDYVKIISENPNAYGFEGESKELTVLFADIRSFTTISEKLSAAELKKLLNRFFTPMTEAIFNRGGTIDKYVGDMIMAFWGAPVEDLEHRKNACQAALDMIAVTEKLKPEFKAEGLPEVNIGVGLNTGIMNVGDMGSSFRRSYTVLGDAVNLGSRIEGTTKFYGVDIAVGEETRADQSEFVFRQLDKVKVKGKAEAVELFELVCRQEEASQKLIDEIARHDQALAAYFSQHWEQALTEFQSLHNEYPDRVIYKLFCDRIIDLQQNPPGKDWDGSYVRTEK